MPDGDAVQRLAAAIPRNVRAVCETLADAGHQAVAVGGAVRDALLGRVPGDWDVATSARPEEVMALFDRTVPTGIAHGTVTIVTGKGIESHVEVTTFRGEGAYSDARRPDHVTFGVPLVDDLARRDLRVNAIAYDPATGALIDPYDGATDIAERVLRAVGPTGNVYDDGVARFTEDGLRVMRAVRFAAALEFALDPDTERAIAPALPSLAKVSKERIADELRKILATRQPSRALAIAERTGIIALILPDLARGFATWATAIAATGSATPATADAASAPSRDVVPGSPSDAASDSPRAAVSGAAIARWLARVDAAAPVARLGALVAELADPDPSLRRLDRGSQRRAEAVLRRLTFSNDEIATAAVLVGAAAASLAEGWTDEETRRLLADITRRHAPAAVALWRADGATDLANRAAAILERRDPLATGELAVTGAVLMTALEMPPGPAVGRLLAALLDRVLADPSLNTADQLIAIARGLELALAR